MTSRLAADESALVELTAGVVGRGSTDGQVQAQTHHDGAASHTNADGSELTPPGCPYRIKAVRPIFTGRWMGARQVDFSHGDNDGVWQVAYRTSKLAHNSVDGLLVIPVVRYAADPTRPPAIILISQFRIPIMSWCLEFPAGLLDPDETVEQCAFRELKEETGYTASKLLRISKITALDPGLVDATANVAIVEVNGDAAENAAPVQSLKHGEPRIDVHLVPQPQLMAFIEQKNTAEQMCCEMALYSFAAGFQLASGLL